MIYQKQSHLKQPEILSVSVFPVQKNARLRVKQELLQYLWDLRERQCHNQLDAVRAENLLPHLQQYMRLLFQEKYLNQMG